MDGLISLLIIIGLTALGSSRRKKQAESKKAAARRAFETSRSEEGAARQPQPREWMGKIAEEIAEDLPVQEVMDILREKAPAPKAPPLTRQPLPRNPHDDDPEGSISTQGLHSTQGESREEHAAHVRRIAREEQQHADAHEALREARSMNLKKLRSAVVMSEILGKPVSLRPRSYR